MQWLALLAFVATRGLSRSRLTTTLLVLAVTAGVGMQIPNTANLLGYSHTMFEEATTRGFGDVRVEHPKEPVFDEGDALATRLAAVPGVRAAVRSSRCRRASRPTAARSSASCTASIRRASGSRTAFAKASTSPATACSWGRGSPPSSG